MKRTTLFFILLFTGLLFLNSCNTNSRFGIDTTQNRIQVRIHRFDKDLLTLDTTKIIAGVNSLYTHYPAFMPVYTSEVLDTSASDTAAIRKLFVQFLSDSTFSSVNKKTLETFGDVSDIEKTVSDAFTYIHHYFPEVILPDVYFFVSGFNRQVIMDNKFIGIGTDFYLGSNFPAYKDLTYKYMLYNMRRECVATDLVSATLFRMFIMNSQQNRLLDNMIYRGRIMYLLSVFMPEEKPENLMGYTAEQWKWCNTYQKEIWGATIDQKDLFSTDLTLIGKYMNDAPFTAPISQDSPGRLGTWIGWQIVKSYMKRNSHTSLTELMNENNYQKILENSGYRP
ncbi:MAG: hypothetical protein WC542_07500 [Paludibacter sp.]